jgi:predicted phosphodiesterase
LKKKISRNLNPNRNQKPISPAEFMKILIKFFPLFFLGFFLIFFVYFFYKPNLNSEKKVSFLALKEKQPLLQLAIMADIHSDWEKLNKAVIKINNNKNIDLILVLGDITNLGSLKDLKTAKNHLNNLIKNYYPLSGNHDVWYSKNDGFQADYYFQQVFGPKPFCQTIKNFNLVFLDNSDEKNPISADSWQEILKCLRKSEPLLFFAHEPLYHPVNERQMGQFLTSLASQKEELLVLLCQKKAKLVMSAHLHSFAKYNYSCQDGYQLPMVIAPALSRERNFQSPRYLEVKIFNDGSFSEEEILAEAGD